MISQRPSSPQPTKKKPFISTTKRRDVFGSPPPKPINKSVNLDKDKDIVTDTHEIIEKPHDVGGKAVEMDSQSLEFIEPDCILSSHMAQFYRCSSRWLQLTHTLWILAVLETERKSADKEGFANFYQVIRWRAQGLITDVEFSAMFMEWSCMGHKAISQIYSHNTRPTNTSIGLFTLRQILLGNECLDETDLDLFIGMLINETNKMFIGEPISSFKTNQVSTIIPRGRTQVEICSERWIGLVEELFFLLDSPGYGLLSFDDIYFLMACCIIGCRNKTNSDDLRDDLSVGMIGAYTVQFLADCGNETLPTANPSKRDRYSGNKYPTYVITLTKFKHILIKKGLSQRVLAALLRHVKTCLERIVLTMQDSLQKPQSYDLLRLSMHPIENHESIGSPKLWQRAVLSSVDYDAASENLPLILPPIIAFLLTDAETMANIFYRGSEKVYGPVQGHDSISSETSEAGRLLWTNFRSWGLNPGNSQSTLADSLKDLMADPTYHLILTVLMTYKAFQMDFSNLLFATTRRFDDPDDLDEDLLFGCMQLLPNIENILLSFDHDSSVDGQEKKSMSPSTDRAIDQSLRSDGLSTSKSTNNSSNNTDKIIDNMNISSESESSAQSRNIATEESKESAGSKWTTLFDVRREKPVDNTLPLSNPIEPLRVVADELIKEISSIVRPVAASRSISVGQGHGHETLSLSMRPGQPQVKANDTMDGSIATSLNENKGKGMNPPPVQSNRSSSSSSSLARSPKQETKIVVSGIGPIINTNLNALTSSSPIITSNPLIPGTVAAGHGNPSTSKMSQGISSFNTANEELQLAIRRIVDELVVCNDLDQQSKLVNALQVLKQIDSKSTLPSQPTPSNPTESSNNSDKLSNDRKKSHPAPSSSPVMGGITSSSTSNIPRLTKAKTSSPNYRSMGRSLSIKKANDPRKPSPTKKPPFAALNDVHGGKSRYSATEMNLNAF